MRARSALVLASAVLFQALITAPTVHAKDMDVDGTGDLPGYAFRDFVVTPTETARVNIASGNLFVRSLDAPASSDGVFVERFYNSLAPADRDLANYDLGEGWHYGTGPYVRLDADGADRVRFTGPSGYQVWFRRRADGTYVSASHYGDAPVLAATLEATAGGHVLSLPDGARLEFDQSGRLVAQIDASGRRTLAFYWTYQGRQLLDRLIPTRPGGQTSTFINADRLIEIDHPGNQNRYAYTSATAGRHLARWDQDQPEHNVL